MFTNVDVRGVSRGHCTTNGCECDGFTRPSSLESSSIQAAPLQCGWCCYCGHSPVSHSRLVIPEVASSSPGISSVNWGCTVQTPFRDQATLVHSAREGRTELETAHLASTSQLADVYPSKCEPASSPEPEPRAECEATPQSAAAWMRQESPLRHTPPQPESNSRPNATFVQESEPGLEPPRKRSCIEQGTEDEGWSSMSPTPTEACQEFSGCACGLGQKVEQLEHEKQDLMRQLTDAQNVAGTHPSTKSKLACLADEADEDASSLGSGRQEIRESELQQLRSKSDKLKEENQQLKEAVQQLKDELQQARDSLNAAEMVKRLERMLERNDHPESTPVVTARTVDIGNGVLIDEGKLATIKADSKNSGTKFARCLLRALFSPEEFAGKSLFGRKPNAFKDVQQKEQLDSVKVNAIIGYTIRNYDVAAVHVKNTLASLLARKR